MALIQFNNIFKGFSGEYILKNLNFSVDEKDKIGLIGQNGAGKTTLISHQSKTMPNLKPKLNHKSNPRQKAFGLMCVAPKNTKQGICQIA